MENYKQYIISQNGKEKGLAYDDIQKYLLTPYQFEQFTDFIRGQTCSMIGGISIIYTGDYERFIKGLPVID